METHKWIITHSEKKINFIFASIAKLAEFSLWGVCTPCLMSEHRAAASYRFRFTNVYHSGKRDVEDKDIEPLIKIKAFPQQKVVIDQIFIDRKDTLEEERAAKEQVRN